MHLIALLCNPLLSHRMRSNKTREPESSFSQSNPMSDNNDGKSHLTSGDEVKSSQVLKGDLQGAQFWKDWHKSGGDVDEYMKETLPNYGLVGALLLTVTIAAVIYPPTFGFNGKDDAEQGDAVVYIYVILMNISTVCSLACILLSITVYQQYVNAYSNELRIGFAAKFGWVLSLMAMLLTVDIVTMFAAMFCVVATTYKAGAAVISILIVIVGTLLTVWLQFYIIGWNASTYSKQMLIDIENNISSETEKDIPVLTEELKTALDNFANALKVR